MTTINLRTPWSTMSCQLWGTPRSFTWPLLVFTVSQRRWTLTSSRQRSYCSLWLSFSKAKAEFWSCEHKDTIRTPNQNQTAAMETDAAAGPSCGEEETCFSKVICQRWAPTANNILQRSTERKVRRMEAMMLNFGAAASHSECGPNKNISSTCRSMRRHPIDLWEFPICQRRAAY